MGFYNLAMPNHSSNMHDQRYRGFIMRLVQARLDAGLTQSEVAKKLRKPQSYVSKCEHGERRVDFPELELFAKIYGKTLDYFKTI